MKLPPFAYHAAASVDEVLGLLAEHGDDAKVLAGGQSLVPLLALRLARPEVLVDITRVPELRGITNGDGLHIGAATRHGDVERSAVAASANPLLASAIPFIGHGAIRNRGTVGGSVAHGDPAAELPTVLVALDGEVEVAGRSGTRRVPASQLYRGFLTTVLEAEELLTAVHLPAWPAGAGWSFQEFSRRSGDFAVTGVAAVVRLGADGTVAEARIALSGVDQTPVRATTAEAALAGQAPSAGAWADAGAAAAAGLDPPSDLHGTSAYRRHLAEVLVRRALHEAHERAEATA